MIKVESKLLIESLLSGDEQIAVQIVDGHFQELARVASRNLMGVTNRSTSPEDVVQSAFRRFFSRASEGAYRGIESQSELLRLLKKITRDRAIDLVRQHHSVKHGGGKVRGESAMLAAYGDCGINAAPSVNIDVEGQLVLRSEFESLLEQLEDTKLVEVALLRFEGHNVAEISAALSCSKRTVERRLRLIRKIWERHSPSSICDRLPSDSSQ